MEMVCACMYMCVSVFVHMCKCVIIIPRKNRGLKKSRDLHNYGSEVEEKGLITDITYLETSFCLCRDFDMVLAIFSFKILVILAIFFIAEPCPDFFFFFQKISPLPK